MARGGISAINGDITSGQNLTHVVLEKNIHARDVCQNTSIKTNNF